MAANITVLLLLITSCIVTGFTKNDELSELLTNIISGSHLHAYNYEKDLYIIENHELEENLRASQKIQIQMYYECLCPDCIEFDNHAFKQAILNLDKYLDISTYPYGFAKTMKDSNGRITFKCQHGPDECYGNKLHACALDIITNRTQALLYNTCMMEKTPGSRGSDDQAAERCAKSMQLDPEPIKSCAKGSKGVQLLDHYGKESKKINYTYVPYILVNGKESDEKNFIKDICSAFASPPPQCLQY